MDETRFDTLIRSLTESRSRRRFAGMLSGFTLVPLLAVADTAAKRKKKKRKKKKAPPPLPPSPPPPPPPTCEETGCSYFEVCQAGVCTNCLGQACSGNGDCCTGLCAIDHCSCIAGGLLSCTSHVQCCNGNCNLDTHQCACDPAGSPCSVSSPVTCCSGQCQSVGLELGYCV